MGLSKNKITEKVLTDQINATIPQGKLFNLHSIEDKRFRLDSPLRKFLQTEDCC